MGDTSAGARRLEHQPALDGLRALAVTMVLLFHGGVSWMRGGYFGVSVFFTLSGFLITSLLVREHASTQRIAPGAFYMRRAKRLLPASTLCLAVISLMATRDAWEGANHLRRDATGALLQVANWVQLGSGASYTDLQSKAAGLLSPLDHYWSLAIEEQFYWIWPLAFWGLARLAGRRGWSLTRILFTLTVAFAAVAPLIALKWGRDAAYWATPARAAEILIGALLAVAVHEGKVAPRRWMAPVSLVAVVTIGVVLPAAGGPAYHGAFPLLAISSAGLLLGLQHRDASGAGRVTSVLSWRPLVGLGAISYGVYLFHFPVYVFMSSDRVDRSGWQLLALRIVVTMAIALASYWLIERPIRRATWTGARTLMNAVVAIGVAMLAIVFVPTRNAAYWTASAQAVTAAEIPSGGTVVALAPAGPSQVATTAPPTTLGAPTTSAADSADERDPTAEQTPQTTVAPPLANFVPITLVTNSSVPAPPEVPVVPVLNRPVRIIVVGDSTAQATGAGLVNWAALNPDVAKVTVLAAPGCGFIRGGVVPTDGDVPFTQHCNQVLDHDLPDALRDLQPDIVMLMTTIRDVEPRVFEASEGPLTPLDSRFVNRARVDYAAITDLILTTSTAHVVWIKPPLIDPYWKGGQSPANDPVAHSVMEVLMGGMVFWHEDRVVVLDLRSWLEQVGLAGDHDVRPDGIHFSPESALDVATRWLGPELVIEATR